MEKNGMVTIRMTEEEAKRIYSSLIEVLKSLDFAAESIGDLFDMILPVVVEIKKEKKTNPGEDEKITCENCALLCLANPVFRCIKDALKDNPEVVAEKRSSLLQKYKEELRERLESQ